MTTLRRIYFRFVKRYRRLELRHVSFDTGNAMMINTAMLSEPLQWRIAPEEDTNRLLGTVYLERRERITQ